MTLSTEQLRRAWAPPKKARGATFLAAYRALDDVLRRWRFDAGKGDTGAYNPRRITGGSGWSLHAYGPGDEFTFWFGVTVTTALAVDIDWNNNPYGPRLVTNMPRAMVDEIEAIRTNNGKQVWSWGGDYSGNKDAMHFEIVCAPADLATGIRSTTPPPAPPPPAPAPTIAQEDDDDMTTYLTVTGNDGKWPGPGTIRITDTTFIQLSADEVAADYATMRAVKRPIVVTEVSQATARHLCSSRADLRAKR